MTEPAFREIQLTKKQLVFLFMASVVLAAAVFLLGVSLGRQLPAGTEMAGSVEPAGTPATPAEMPPATVLTADDQKFATELQGSGAVPPALPQPPPAAPAATPDSGQSAQKPATTTVPATTTIVPKPAEQAPARGAAPVAAAGKPEPAPPSGGWFVQVNAFRSRENAEAEVRQLKAKGHAAFVAPGGSLFRVRVGPFAERTAADSASTQLRQEGFRPSVTR